MKKLLPLALLFFVTVSFAQSLDTTFNPTDVGFGKGDGFSYSVYSTSIQADGKIIAAGGFTTYEGVRRGRIVRLNEDGSLDTSFGNGTGANSSVYSTCLQSDGKIIIGGTFASYDGVSRKSIARLNSDGSLDTGFNPGTGVNNIVRSITVQSDGKIIIAGSFTSFNGVTINRIARLNTDGSLDTGFNPGIGASGISSPAIYSTSIQSDGKIIVGGYFYTYSGTSRAGIVRLNSNGSMDTAFTGTGSSNMGAVYSSLIQSDGKILIGGSFGSYNGVATRNIARLNADGSLDTGFIVGSGTSGIVNALSLQSDGKIIVGGYYGCIRVNTNGTLDSGFSSSGISGSSDSIKTIAVKANGKIIVGGSFSIYQGRVRKKMVELNADGSINLAFGFANTGANGVVYTTSIQSDGKIIIGGSFSGYNDVIKTGIARLNKNGSLDTGFNIALNLESGIYTTVIQSDGKIIVGGSFSASDSSNSIYVNNLARFNTDGSLDTTFFLPTDDNYIDGDIVSLLLQPDGKIIIGGYFTTYRGVVTNGIARLNADGTLDTDFNPGTGMLQSETITSLGIQQDGKIIIGGYFSSYNGVSVNNIARLNSDGSLDATFDSGTGLNYGVDAVCLQTDGKIIIGGIFSSYNDIGRGKIARLNVDGSLDTSFNPPSEEDYSQVNEIRTLALQPDGKIIIGGEFSAYGDVTRNGIARINADGSLDTGFDSGTGLNNTSTTICIQPDGGIIVGGNFTAYNGIGRNRIARINGADVSNPGPIAAQQTFCDGATIANLTAEGSDVKWYNVALGGNPLPLSTVLVNTNYYFSQTVDGIESIRTTVPVFIKPNAVAGSILGAGTICWGSSKTLTLSSIHVGTVQWQSSTISSTTGFSNIEGATANNYTASALTATTYYKAIVTSGDCSSVATLPVTVMVTPSSAVAGYITSSDEDGYVCKYVLATSAGGVGVINSTRLTLKDNAGLISWYRSTNGGTTWYTVTGQTTTSLDVNNLTVTTMFRAKSSTSSPCYSYKYTDPVTINVYPAAVAGVITADSNGYTNVTKVCVGNDITFTSTKHVGNIEWQTSTVSPTGPWTTVGENSSIYKMTNVQGVNNSKIFVKTITTGNAACPSNSKPSAVRTITVTGVAVPGTLSGGKAVCGLGGGTLTLTGAVGAIQWMYSTDDGATYNKVVTGDNVAFTTTSSGKGSTLIVTGVTATTHFKVEATNGNCSSVYSNVQVFTLGNTVAAGTIEGASKVCYGTGTALTVKDAVGAIQWEKATYNQITNTYGTWAPISGKTSETLLTGNLTCSYGYRAAVTICASVSTDIHNVIVDKAVARSITTNVTVPSGTSAATSGSYMPLPADFSIAKKLTVMSGSWGSISWERSLDGVAYTTIPGASGTQYIVNEAASSVAGTLNYYRARFTTSCSPDVTSAPIRLYYKGTGDVATKFAGAETDAAKSTLTVTASPNPYSESFKLKIITSSDAKVEIMVYDVLGKLLEQREVRPSEVSELNLGNNYPTGIYNVILTQEEETKSLHMIKR